MIRVSIYPLEEGEPAMFARTLPLSEAFTYIAFWQSLGHCLIKTEPFP